MRSQRIYLDYNATAPLLPTVKAAMLSAMDCFGNPSSIHNEGRSARHIVEESRRALATLVSVPSEFVAFTASGTEANNWLIKGYKGPVIVAATEHDSIIQPATGLNAKILPVGSDGLIDLDRLSFELARSGAGTLVSVMLANNETGICQDLPTIAKHVHRAGGLLHSDITQAFGRMAVNLSELGCDIASLSVHKAGGPKGVGALIYRPDLMVVPLLAGGGQERRQRAGTENLIAISGLGACVREIAGMVDPPRQKMLRDRFEAFILAQCSQARIIGHQSSRLPNTSCVALPGINAETQVMALDLAGFAVSSGSACSSGKVKESHVLRAMDVPVPYRHGTIRISLGWATQEQDIDAFAAAWLAMASRASVQAAE